MSFFEAVHRLELEELAGAILDELEKTGAAEPEYSAGTDISTPYARRRKRMTEAYTDDTEAGLTFENIQSRADGQARGYYDRRGEIYTTLNRYASGSTENTDAPAEDFRYLDRISEGFRKDGRRYDSGFERF